MDACGSFVVAASAPLEVRVLRVQLGGPLSLAGRPTAAISVVRELSIMSVGQPLRVRAHSLVLLVNPSFPRTPCLKPHCFQGQEDEDLHAKRDWCSAGEAMPQTFDSEPVSSKKHSSTQGFWLGRVAKIGCAA
jgi:hypothetical protein